MVVKCSMQLVLLTKAIFVVDSRLGLNITIVFVDHWSVGSNNRDLACSEASVDSSSASTPVSTLYNTNTSSL